MYGAVCVLRRNPTERPFTVVGANEKSMDDTVDSVAPLELTGDDREDFPAMLAAGTVAHERKAEECLAILAQLTPDERRRCENLWELAKTTPADPADFRTFVGNSSHRQEVKNEAIRRYEAARDERLAVEQHEAAVRAAQADRDFATADENGDEDAKIAAFASHTRDYVRAVDLQRTIRARGAARRRLASRRPVPLTVRRPLTCGARRRQSRVAAPRRRGSRRGAPSRARSPSGDDPGGEPEPPSRWPCDDLTPLRGRCR